MPDDKPSQATASFSLLAIGILILVFLGLQTLIDPSLGQTLTQTLSGYFILGAPIIMALAGIVGLLTSKKRS